MRTMVLGIAATTVTLFSGVAGAADAPAERLRMTLSGAPAELAVEGSEGRYNRLSVPAISLPLTLNAEPTEDGNGFKILKSEVRLKADGRDGAAKAIDTLANQAPVRSLATSDTHRIDIIAQGPVAQLAISACNGIAPSERATTEKRVTVPVTVVWQATTGRSTFKWTNYDRVGPSEDVFANRDFYGETATQDAETTVDVAVACKPLSASNAVASRVTVEPAPTLSKAAVSASAAPETSQQVPLRDPMLQRITARTGDDDDTVDVHAPQVAKDAAPKASPSPAKSDTPTSITTASIASPAKPQCDGGMLRQVSAPDVGYLCLCPGNTERVATGENAFTCEKRTRGR